MPAPVDLDDWSIDARLASVTVVRTSVSQSQSRSRPIHSTPVTPTNGQLRRSLAQQDADQYQYQHRYYSDIALGVVIDDRSEPKESLPDLLDQARFKGRGHVNPIQTSSLRRYSSRTQPTSPTLRLVALNAQRQGTQYQELTEDLFVPQSHHYDSSLLAVPNVRVDIHSENHSPIAIYDDHSPEPISLDAADQPDTSTQLPQQRLRSNTLIVRGPNAWYLLWLVVQNVFQLALSSLLTFWNSGILYTALYGCYLLLFQPSAQTVPPVMWTGLVFLLLTSVRCCLTIASVFYRIRYKQFWINQRRHRWLPSQRLFLYFHWTCKCVRVAVLVPLIAVLAANNQLGDFSTASPEVIVLHLIVLLELAVYGVQGAVFASLLYYFPLKHLSVVAPYVPISQSFNASAMDRRLAEQNRQKVLSLPQTVFRASDACADDSTSARCCSVCLSDFVDGEIMRVLKCEHTFHQPCIDQWLEKRLTCPLCVRDIARTPSHLRDRQRRLANQLSADSHSAQQAAIVEGIELV